LLRASTLIATEPSTTLPSELIAVGLRQSGRTLRWVKKHLARND
jgi:hypothetical protein